MSRIPKGLVYVAFGFGISLFMVVLLGGPDSAFSELIIHLELDIREWRIHLLIFGLILIAWGGFKILKRNS